MTKKDFINNIKFVKYTGSNKDANVNLKIPTPRAVASGLFIMFVSILFYLFLVWLSVKTGHGSWPEGTYMLFATCSGVVMGGQIGTRLIRILWFREHQKHGFIIMLAMSIIHLLW